MSIKSETHYLTWDNFEASFINAGGQRVHRISVSPRIDLFSDGDANRIGLLIAVVSRSLPRISKQLESLAVRIVEHEGQHFLEISPRSAWLHGVFYQLATAIADRVVKGVDPCDALLTELELFTELVEVGAILSIERQIGLFGELVVLDRLYQLGGSEAIAAWVGPLGEPHDFRGNGVEIEVKTTISTRRIHRISSLAQLTPSVGNQLYIMSVMIGPGGIEGGRSLTDVVTTLIDKFAASPVCQSRLMKAINTAGFRNEESQHYSRLFVERRPLALIELQPAIPVIDAGFLARSLGGCASRVEAVQYDLNLEGLGCEEGRVEFTDPLSAIVRQLGI